MARLAGKFVGILVVEVAEERADALVVELTALKNVGLRWSSSARDSRAQHPSTRLDLELLGADHPGIVAEISAALAARRIGIEELSTDIRDAPMAGGMLFEARAVLDAPPATSVDDLRSMLEAFADELMVEIRLSETESGHASLIPGRTTVVCDGDFETSSTRSVVGWRVASADSQELGQAGGDRPAPGRALRRGPEQQAAYDDRVVRIPNARAVARIFTSTEGTVERAMKARKRMSAAEVTSRPVWAMPSTTARSVSSCSSYDSRIRDRMNTS